MYSPATPVFQLITTVYKTAPRWARPDFVAFAFNRGKFVLSRNRYSGTVDGPPPVWARVFILSNAQRPWSTLIQPAKTEMFFLRLISISHSCAENKTEDTPLSANCARHRDILILTEYIKSPHLFSDVGSINA
jgi:hypothetical protein